MSDIFYCPRAKSDMTPCVVSDGKIACADDGVCVGCGEHPANLLKDLVPRYVALKESNSINKLTDDDKKRLTAILDEEDRYKFAHLIFEYYHDADRADRTSRKQMYFHLGMLVESIISLSKKSDRSREQ